ncbi:MAG: hypothetical protein AAF915_16330 [Cyanobacteria bacterium P01_D01_bin.50]
MDSEKLLLFVTVYLQEWPQLSQDPSCCRTLIALLLRSISMNRGIPQQSQKCLFFSTAGYRSVVSSLFSGQNQIG